MYPHVLCLIPRKTCAMRKSANIPAKIPFPATVGRYMKLDKVKSQVSRVQRYGCAKSVSFPTHSACGLSGAPLDVMVKLDIFENLWLINQSVEWDLYVETRIKEENG